MSDSYIPKQPTQTDLEDWLNQPREASRQEIYHDILGREIPDPTPIAPPIGYVPQPSMVDHIRNMIRTELSRSAAEAGEETFDEADDFEVEDELADPHTPYEAVFDPPAPRPEPRPPNLVTSADPPAPSSSDGPSTSAPPPPTVPLGPLDAG